MKSKYKAFTLVVLLSTWSNAYSEVDCVGTVDSLSMQLDSVGTVTISLSGGPSHTYLCDVDGTSARNGVSPAVCRTMFSTLLTAKATGKKVLIRFIDHSSCSAVPGWASAGRLGWTAFLLD